MPLGQLSGFRFGAPRFLGGFPPFSLDLMDDVSVEGGGLEVGWFSSTSSIDLLTHIFFSEIQGGSKVFKTGP